MRKKSGVTLIEVIIAMVVIAIIAVGAFSFFEHCQRFIVDSQLRLIAVNFVRETMEERYWELNPAETPDWAADTPLPTGTGFGSLLRDNYGGTRHYRVSADTGTGTSYRVIETRVTWEY